VHRIGRTARAGAAGNAVSLVAPDEAGLLKDIVRVLRQEIAFAPLPQFAIREPQGGERPVAAEAARVRPQSGSGGGQRRNAAGQGQGQGRGKSQGYSQGARQGGQGRNSAPRGRSGSTVSAPQRRSGPGNDAEGNGGGFSRLS
jgi:ATP-dependent RNA helicase RhlE